MQQRGDPYSLRIHAVFVRQVLGRLLHSQRMQKTAGRKAVLDRHSQVFSRPLIVEAVGLDITVDGGRQIEGCVVPGVQKLADIAGEDDGRK